MNHFAVNLKLTQHYKSTRLQFKKKKKISHSFEQAIARKHAKLVSAKLNVHVSPVQYLWLKLTRKFIALASILWTHRSNGERYNFPFISCQRKTWEKMERKRQRNLTIQSAVKRQKGASGILSHLCIMCLTFPNQWKPSGSPFLWKELSLILAGGKLSE